MRACNPFAGPAAKLLLRHNYAHKHGVCVRAAAESRVWSSGRICRRRRRSVQMWCSVRNNVKNDDDDADSDLFGRAGNLHCVLVVDVSLWLPLGQKKG